MSDEQKLDGLTLADEFKRYMHHYNFPPYSVGEARPLRGPGRREIGHGALAERALLAVIPPVEEWPYTMRLVSEILSSNGSTSMASVCGSTLALMDAGVPIKSPVAGIAMGLVTREGKHAVLTDIQGVEDNLGDMDFKVAGTRDGITALQMDIKIKGLTHEILAQALEQAREAGSSCSTRCSRSCRGLAREMSAYAPRITTIMINPDKIRDIIGPGGKMIRKITEETGAQIDVEDDGRVFIAAVDQAGGQRAIDWIKGLTDEVEVGRIYKGKVVRIMPFGAFVEVLPEPGRPGAHLQAHRPPRRARRGGRQRRRRDRGQGDRDRQPGPAQPQPPGGDRGADREGPADRGEDRPGGDGGRAGGAAGAARERRSAVAAAGATAAAATAAAAAADQDARRVGT